MVKNSTSYRQAIGERGLSAGRFLSVAAAEHLSGLPRGWSSPRAGDVNPEDLRRHFPDGEAGPQNCGPLVIV